jgi:NAD(P)-dependent dehydrogenase (short-subunit alcohol dehydrogenase family)
MAENDIRTYSSAVAVITGGGSGIGAALGRGLGGRGATVVLADRRADAAAAVADAIRQAGGSAAARGLDVRDAGAVEALVSDVASRHGRLDYLFNNAGTGVAGEVKDYTLDDWRYVVDVNLMGVIHGVHAAYPRMVEQGFGHIVNTSSMAGWMPTPMTTVYGTTKHALVGLSRSLRVEAADHGVRVSVVCPGVIRTALLVNGGPFGRVKIAVPADAQLALWERVRPMDPDVFASHILRQVQRNQSIIIAPRWWLAVFWLNRLSTRLGDVLARRMYREMKKQLEAAATQRSTPA